MLSISERAAIFLGSIYAAIVALLNIAVFSFYALWQNADAWAVNRSEANGALDTQQLLPHGDLMWVASNVSVALLLALDIFSAAAIVVLARRSRAAVKLREVPKVPMAR